MDQDETNESKLQFMAESSKYFRIVAEHEKLEARLSELSLKDSLLVDEKTEAGLIKKRKLVLKDELETMARELD
jgi:uncharacterized protein YdcH (DUF465 family)